MIIRLNNLHIYPQYKKKTKKRLGRGIGSGLGKTSGKGHKGQKSRSGFKMHRMFEGGQTPFYRRIPKFGFKKKNFKKKLLVELPVYVLNKFKNFTKVNIILLKKNNLVPFITKRVKIILSGKLSKTIYINDKNISVTYGVKRILKSNLIDN